MEAVRLLLGDGELCEQGLSDDKMHRTVATTVVVDVSDNWLHRDHSWHRVIDENYLEELSASARQCAALYTQRKYLLCGAKSL